MSRMQGTLVLSLTVISVASWAHPPPEYAQPAPVYVTPPVVVVPQNEVRSETRPQPRPGMLAIKYMPGAASWVLVDNHTSQTIDLKNQSIDLLHLPKELLALTRMLARR